MNHDQIEVNTQSSIRIGGSYVIRFDPFKVSGDPHDTDLICVTHAHYDHLDPDSIEKVRKPETVFVAPLSMEADLRKLVRGENLHLLSPGDVLSWNGISVTAVPAFNKMKPFHPKRNHWLGYILEMDGIRYYVAGDTDAIQELQDIRCDIALVPIGGTFTMTAKEAAGLINVIKPAVAIPTHYGSIVGKRKDADIFRNMTDKEIQVVTKL